MIALAGVLLLIATSYVVHEYGHAFMAKALGWKLHGWVFHLPWSVGYMVEGGGRPGMRAIAASGLMVTLMLAAIGEAWGGPYGLTLLYMNAAILFCNCLPIPGSDGWMLVRGRR